MANFVNWLKDTILSGIEYIKNSVASGRDWIRENIIDRFQEEEEEEFKTAEEGEEEPKQYEIIQIGEKSNKKFTTFFDIFKVEPHQSTEIDFGKLLLEIANRVIKKRGLKDGDKIRWILSHSLWNNPISTKLITISGSITANNLINELVNFVEYKEVPLSEVKIEIQSIKIPRGMGRLRVMKSNLNQKKSVITIKNDDSICLARAIVTAVANINKTHWTKTQLKDGFNRSRQLQKMEAEKLHEEAGVEINEFGSTLEDVIKFANHLKIQINIVDFEYFNELLLTTENEHNNQMIYLLKNKNHFDVITSMTGFLCKDYYCHTCKKTYKKRDCHKCPRKCLACFKYFKDGNLCSGEIIECQDCNRSFFGKECFDEHKRNRAKIIQSRLEIYEYLEQNGIKFKRSIKDNMIFQLDTYELKNGGDCPLEEFKQNLQEAENFNQKIDIVCNQVKKCSKCKQNVKNLVKHKCCYSECKNCKEYCDMNKHNCYMKVKLCKGGNCTEKQKRKNGKDCLTNKKDNEDNEDNEDEDNEDEKDNKICYACQTRNIKYMFYDFETNQETGVHVVNWVDCEDYDGNKNTFETIDEFCVFIFDEKYKKFTFIAHNAKGYDAQFIRNWCIENNMKPYCIYNGTKIIYMTVSGRRFIDSLSFIAAPLSTFPKTFGLMALKKGYFPHYFNKKHNQNYVGPIPSKKHYGYDQMNSSARKAFLEWYNAKKDENYVFNFKKELRDYCRSDVDILRRSMLKFRNDFIELENIDPLQYITIASVCMTIYRSNYMPNNEISVVKDIINSETYSKISIAWLDWKSERDGSYIRHALNCNEKTFQSLNGKTFPLEKVDGFCKESNTVYEYQECFWHGCEKCFSNDAINPKKST